MRLATPQFEEEKKNHTFRKKQTNIQQQIQQQRINRASTPPTEPPAIPPMLLLFPELSPSGEGELHLRDQLMDMIQVNMRRRKEFHHLE